MSTVTTKIPDGKGGWLEVAGEVHKGTKADPKKQAEIYQKEFIEDAATVTEMFAKFAPGIVKERGLSKEHLVFSIALYCVNLREEYPDGTDAFDTVAQAAADYRDQNAPRKPKK